ncbi:hypothetical protein [Haloarchaeobius amylolyticus]|uniref:hypothetical protein n=1 Tax=Haloarchaeobius amylolyticus TaxID=1198296 RepID=UPI002270BB8B|nr:hypothetical protein [Haloarchaeobius amylolyticus]
MNGRLVLAVVLALTVLSAGCLSGDTGADVTTTPTTAGSGGGGDGSGDGAGDGSGDGGPVSSLQPGEWTVFDFDEPATYTYDVYMEGEGDGQLVWDVQSVDGDTVTVRMVYDVAGERFESTVTGTKETVQSQLYTNPAGILLVTTMFTPATWYAGQDLSEGTKWSYTTQDGSASFAVTGTDTYANVECYASEMTVDGQVLHAGCFAPQLGLAPYSAYYNEDGTLSMEMTLVSYEKN